MTGAAAAMAHQCSRRPRRLLAWADHPRLRAWLHRASRPPVASRADRRL